LLNVETPSYFGIVTPAKEGVIQPKKRSNRRPATAAVKELAIKWSSVVRPPPSRRLRGGKLFEACLARHLRIRTFLNVMKGLISS
jgi:hypothetical protein